MENRNLKDARAGGFVRVADLDGSLIVDLRYATADNFTHRRIYPQAVCLLRRGTAEKLCRASAALRRDGCRLKIWDAYRPLAVQKLFWDILPDNRFVANPANGSIHNRGCAVDVTLTDMAGRELPMPSAFDAFDRSAYRDNPDMPPLARENLGRLTRAMVAGGFETLSTEWWHYVDSDRQLYPVADVPLELFAGPAGQNLSDYGIIQGKINGMAEKRI